MPNPTQPPFNGEGAEGMGRNNADFFESIGISRNEQSKITQRALLPLAGVQPTIAWNNDVPRSFSEATANRRANAQHRRAKRQKGR